MICEIKRYGKRDADGIKSRDGERRVWHSSNMVNLCVDFCNREKQSGNLYHLYTREPVAFSSLLEAINRMNELYDELQFPQASTELRSFRTDRRLKVYAVGKRGGPAEYRRKEKTEMEEFDKVIGHRGAQGTFLIRVQYRQHSSWQGEVTWVEQQKKEYFRSALELIRLLDSALNTEEKKDAE